MSYIEIDLTNCDTPDKFKNAIDNGIAQSTNTHKPKSNSITINPKKPPIVETDDNSLGLKFQFGKKKDKSTFLKEFPKASDLGIHGAFLPMDQHKTFTQNKQNKPLIQIYTTYNPKTIKLGRKNMTPIF